jgi:hypothetical protein
MTAPLADTVREYIIKEEFFMKKTTYGMAAALIGAVMILASAGCGSAPPPKPAEPERPDWVENPPEDEELIYGMGSAVSSNESRG